MKFTSFTTLVKNEVEKRAGEKYKVRLNNVIKNNGVVLSGITFMQDDSNISPTIYLNNYYDAYENGQTTLGMVVNDVMNVYNRNKVNRSVDMKYFLDYERIKDSIVLKLINTEKNKELLSDVPHVEFLDLSIVFSCLVSEEQFGNASIMIHNAHTKLWNISVDDLYKKACINTPKLQEYKISSMKEVICEMMGDESVSDDGKNYCIEGLSSDIPMYVLSNKNMVDGAASMLYPELLDDFAGVLGSDLYIIPSSIHEVLLLPVKSLDNSQGIKDMIHEINKEHVSAEEVLSDSLYFYDRINKNISIL